MSVLPGQVITTCGDTRENIHMHALTHTKCQEVATYFTDFIDLSSLPAGLLPGDSFLLRRKASRFFMSLALHEVWGGGGNLKKKEEKKLVRNKDLQKCNQILLY